MKIVIKIFVVMFVCLSISACEFTSSPKITMNPVEDAKTCIKLYEKDELTGRAYMEDVIATYYMKGKHSECDRFSSIVAEEIARISF